jgi:hypothetical protein
MENLPTRYKMSGMNTPDYWTYSIGLILVTALVIVV